MRESGASTVEEPPNEEAWHGQENHPDPGAYRPQRDPREKVYYLLEQQDEAIVDVVLRCTLHEAGKDIQGTPVGVLIDTVDKVKDRRGDGDGDERKRIGNKSDQRPAY